jgi:flagellar FliL protein
MSAAPAETVEDGHARAPFARGKKKLIILVASAVLVVAGLGGGAAVIIKKKREAAEAAAAEGDDDGPVAHAAEHKDSHKGPPAFLPLDAFIVNLADRDTERFAQVGITLELEEPKFADELRAYMPAIRNGILMVLAHKSSQELLTRAGKEKLALEVMRESVRPLGIELEDGGGDAKPRPEGEDKTAKTPLPESPVRHVHFSSFIIQ